MKKYVFLISAVITVLMITGCKPAYLPQRNIQAIVDYSIVSVDSEFTFNELKLKTTPELQNPMLAQQGAIGGLASQIIIELNREDQTNVKESYEKINHVVKASDYSNEYNDLLIAHFSKAAKLKPLKPIERTNYLANSIPEATIKTNVYWSRKLSHFKIVSRVNLKVPASTSGDKSPTYYVNDFIYISDYVEKLPMDESRYQLELAKVEKLYDKKIERRSSQYARKKLKQKKIEQLNTLEQFVKAGEDFQLFSEYWSNNSGEQINKNLKGFPEEFERMLQEDLKLAISEHGNSETETRQVKSNSTRVISEQNDRVIIKDNFNGKLCSLKKGTSTRLCL